MSINLVCGTMVLLNEIETLKLPQRDVALTMAMAMKSEAEGVDRIDWERVAQAALDRWSPSGWRRIKERAWGIAEGRIEI